MFEPPPREISEIGMWETEVSEEEIQEKMAELKKGQQ